jgi:hypothetical protein
MPPARGHTTGRYRSFKEGAGFPPVRTLGILEGDGDHRIFVLLGAVRGVGPDLGALEEVRIAFSRLLEERLEHVHRERLAEAARTRENGDRGLLVEKSRDELRLVGRPIFRPDRSPVAVAHRKCREPGALSGVRVFHGDILPNRPRRRKDGPRNDGPVSQG